MSVRRSILLAVTALIFFGVAYAQTSAPPSDNATATAASAGDEQYDAVCKGDSLQDGNVIVGQLQSPQCGNAKNLVFYNAWEVAPAKEGIASCVSPDYMNADGRVIRYVGCGGTAASGCPSRADSGPNAFVLKRPSQCDDNFTSTQCEDDRNPVGHPNSVIVSEKIVPQCPAPAAIKIGMVSFGSQPYNWTKRRSMTPGAFAPVCAAFFPDSVADYYARRLDFKILVVRAFFDSDCPKRISGNVEVVNAYVLKMIDKRGSPKSEFACRKSILSIDPFMSFTHDDRCGNGNALNSGTVHLP